MHGPAYDSTDTQVTDIVDAEVIVQNDWYLMDPHGDTDAVATINISGSSVVKILNLNGGLAMRGHDRGTTNLNILSTGSGDPCFIANGEINLANETAGVGNFTMTGGYFEAKGLTFAQDGIGTCTITGGTMILGDSGLFMEGRNGGHHKFTLDGGAYVETTGRFGCPTSNENDNTGDIYLNSGTLICGSFDQSDSGWILDIDDAVLWKIKGNHLAQIQGFIDLGLITGNGVGLAQGPDTPSVIYDGVYTRVGFDLVQKYAYEPSPVSGTSGICPENGITLTWTAGGKAERHEVFFGTDSAIVEAMTTPTALRDLGNESYDTGWLEYNKTYYWRIDEVNDSDPYTWKGAVWQFSTPNGKASDPSPFNGRRGMLPGPVLLRWTLPCYLTGQTLYYGTTFPQDGTWTSVILGPAEHEYELTVGQFEHHYWRVDTEAGTAGGTITGDSWDFTTGFGGLLMYYKFDGTIGSDLPSPVTDDGGNVIQFTKYTSGGGTLKYGESNPGLDTSTASADLEPDAGLYRLDTGDNDSQMLRLDGSEYTVELWLKPESWTDVDEIWLLYKDGSWGLKIDSLPGCSGEGCNQNYRWFSSGNETASTQDDVAVLDEWIHLAVVRDQGGDLGGFYVNGEKQGDGGGDGGGPNPSDNNSPVWIGAAGLPGGGFRDGGVYDGLIDEIRVHDIAIGPCGFLTESRPAGYPLCPSPDNGAMAIDPCGLILSWMPGESATSHKVYFSSDYDLVSTMDISAYLDEYPSSVSSPLNLDYGTTYYWRVVELPGGEQGEIWQFTTEYQVEDASQSLHLTLDETGGDTAYDSSGYGNHGDVDDDDGWDPEDGQFGGSFIFNDDNRIDVSDDATSELTSSISISCWLKNASKQYANNWVFGIGSGPYQVCAAVPLADGQTVEWRAGNDSNDVLVWDMVHAGIDPATLSGWHHWVFIKDETAGNMKIYLDNQVVEANDIVDASLIRLRSSELTIGAASGHDSDLKGSVDDFRMFTKALTSSEVEVLFRGGDLALAWAPSPFTGQKDTALDSVLSWKSGNFAVQHDVYFGTSLSDVTDANTAVPLGVYIGRQAIDANSYDPYGPGGDLPLNTAYYWRIDEVNDACNASPWKGRIWTFTTANYILIDDFESYNDSDNLIYDTWLEDAGAVLYDFYAGDPTHSGEQSMWFTYYNNHDYSEVGKDLSGMDFTQAGVKALTVFFYGDPTNDAGSTEEPYMGIDDGSTYAESRYLATGNPISDIQEEEWHEWNVPISDLNTVTLTSVQHIYIGFGQRGSSVVGGEGNVFIDDVRLYPPKCVPELGPEWDWSGNCIVDYADIGIMADNWLRTDANLSPVTNPGTTGLVGWWKLDDGSGVTATDTANGNNGTLEGSTTWVAGHIGTGAVEFGSDDARIRILPAAVLMPASTVSVTAWIYPTSVSGYSARVVAKGIDTGDWEAYYMQFNGSPSWTIRDPNHENHPLDGSQLNLNEWTHLAGTYDGDALKLYVNGLLDAEDTTGGLAMLQDGNDLSIGNRSDGDDRAFVGTIDDVRVYDYALSVEEVAYIATQGTGYIGLDSQVNIYDEEDPGQKVVNFRDLAKLMTSWLEEKLWP